MEEMRDCTIKEFMRVNPIGYLKMLLRLERQKVRKLTAQLEGQS